MMMDDDYGWMVVVVIICNVGFGLMIYYLSH